MDVTRMSIARVLELGVPISWREAAAVVFEGVSTAHDREGRATSRVAPDSCLITRGGEVVLSDDASCGDPEAIAGLAADLLTGCADRGDLGAALDAGRLLPFLEKLGEDTTWKRRRVQIAALALRALNAEADCAVADHGDASRQSQRQPRPGAANPRTALVTARVIRLGRPWRHRPPAPVSGCGKPASDKHSQWSWRCRRARRSRRPV